MNIQAPFTEEQVAALKRWQTCDRVHPFTCCDHQTMTVDRDGFHCAVCGRLQNWCHDFMAAADSLPDPPYPDTFEISKDGKSIKCLRCERTSHNPNDVEHRYCGFCHQFHDDIWPPAREDWIKRKPREADTGATKNMN